MKIEDKKMSLITEHTAPKPFIGGKGYLVKEFAFANDSTMQEYMNERDLHYITHGVTMKRTAETV